MWWWWQDRCGGAVYDRINGGYLRSFPSFHRDNNDAKQEENNNDSDFVLVKCGSTWSINSSRCFVLKSLMTVIPRCCLLGMSLFEEYEKSTATVFCSEFLAAMKKNAHFTNKKLLSGFKKSVDANRCRILENA